ncbi:hypothetical protein Tco_1144852 [Tanacetum coccineum]
MGRDTVQLETTVSTISQEYLLEFTFEYDISEGLHPKLPGRGDRIVDFPEGKVGVYTKFFDFANFRIPISQFLFYILGHYQIHLSQLSVIGAAKVSHFEIQCRVLNIIPSVNLFRVFYTPSFNSGWMSFSKRPGKNTPQCYTKPLDSLKNWNNRFFWVDEKVFPTVVDWRISAPKDGMPAEDTYSVEDVVLLNTRRTPIQKQPELLLCLVGLSRRYFLGDDVYPTFLYDDGREMDLFNLISAPNPAIDTTTTEVALEVNLEREVTTMGPLVNKRRRKRDQSKTEANVPPKVLRTDHASVCPESHTRGGNSLAAMGLGAGSTVPTPIPQETPADVIGPDPLSYTRPQSILERDISQSSKGTSAAKDPESKTSTSFTSLAGSPGGYFSKLRHLPNLEFLSQYNMTLARQVAIGSQLRLRFKQEVRLRREATAKIARCDQRIQAREDEIKKLDEEVQSLRVVETEVHGLRNRTQNLETLLEAEVDMKKAAEAKNAELISTLQSQITGEEKIKAAFEEFKRYEDDRVIGHGLRLAVLKCVESIELKQDFANVVSAGIAKGFYDGLKYGVELGELEKLKDASMDIIMASLYLESDTGEDASQWIRDIRLSSSQLKIPMYPEVRDPKDPWAFKEELLLKDVIAANVSRAEKKRKCRIVCRTHGVGSAHHARSDGIPVSVPTAPQGLQILLKDAASQTELPEDGASPRLVRSKSLPAMYNLDWP